MGMRRSPTNHGLFRNNRAYWEGSAGLWYGRTVLLLGSKHIGGTDRTTLRRGELGVIEEE
jgi:hypothetical protein